MSRTKTAAIAIGVAGLGMLAWGASRSSRRPSRASSAGARPRRRLSPPATKRGSVVCPLELSRVPVPLSTAKPGDFVSLRLADTAGTFTELVWGVIDAIHGKGVAMNKLPRGTQATGMVVTLTGSIGQASVKTPESDIHGFDIGNTLVLEDNCAWEHFHASPKGMALCGLFGEQVSGGETPALAGAVVAGEEVLVYLAPVKEGTSLSPGPGWDVPNPVWARVIRVSASRSILRVTLLDDPLARAGMTLRKGDAIDISRDCIFGVRPGGS